MTGRRLVLLRHGRTSWNDAGRAQGHADVPLDVLGHQQAGRAAAYLASLSPSALWSSDLARARETCDYLERVSGLSAKHDQRLREFDVGARQGLTMAELADRFPAEYAEWCAGDPIPPVEGSESAHDVEERIVPALREAFGSLRGGETGIAVTHGAALKVAVAGLLGWPRAVTGTLAGIDNCAWATLEETETGGRLRLAGYNEKAPTDRGAT